MRFIAAGHGDAGFELSQTTAFGTPPDRAEGVDVRPVQRRATGQCIPLRNCERGSEPTSGRQRRALNLGAAIRDFFVVIRSTFCVGEGPKVKADGRELICSDQMTEAVIITNEELAILCDIVAGWSVKRAANLAADKRQALDRAHGYRAGRRLLSCNISTAKTELLFAQLCVGISGG